ncbi:hypothetical protein HNR60_003558 [Rhodopseudomonas rhenobacensis]|uniref:Uncharacterized protein n=1 Tax=Rhodopseudomonas rhenobacensis TaxID=87461 RepID=A0A7W7Z683_9BRAD|nr:hypothetical protein [Rhodopseudomonas rhenobacensis]MBB5048788.1 hypothetical protein [Rhodopseudomonas rhenobacensis]
MPTKLMPLIFTIDIAGLPILTFEAANLREAHEVCHERWLLADLKQMTRRGVPVWDGKTRLRARYATEDEKSVYRNAPAAAQEAGELKLVYLVEADGADIHTTQAAE